ncbi:MAG: chaperone NapD [Burkholderiales bacterium]|nr:chaperone NapD [Burkholderiales bacterium]
MNVSGVVVRTRPEQGAALENALNALPGVHVHARSAEGRLAVTIEDHASASAADTYVRLHALPGVYAVDLVYQYSDENETIYEELPS